MMQPRYYTRLRGPALVAIVAAIVLAVGLAAPRPASAGEYTISACQADEAGYVSSAFESFATRGMKWRRACDPRGDRAPRTRHSERPSAPVAWRRGAVRVHPQCPARDDFLPPPLVRPGAASRLPLCPPAFAERPGASPVSIKNVRANRSCPRPGLAQASAAPLPRAYDLGGATRIVQRVVCVGAPAHQFCSARGQNYIRTFSAEATVVDGTPLRSGVVPSSPLTQERVGAGKADASSYDASDNVGVKSASALISGGLRGTDPGHALTRSASPVRTGLGDRESIPPMLPKARSR